VNDVYYDNRIPSPSRLASAVMEYFDKYPDSKNVKLRIDGGME